MIKILKKQSSSFRVLLVALLFLPLCGFFYYAVFVQSQFVIFYLIAFSILVGMAVFFRRRFVMSRTQSDIRRQDFLEQANLLESEIEREWQSLRAIEKKIVDYGRLKEIAEKLNSSFSQHETSKVLSTEVSRLFGQEEATVILYLFHSKTGELGLSASQKGQMEVSLKAKKGDLYDHWVVKNLQALLIEDTKNDFRFDAEKIQTEDSRPIRSLMSVPMTVGNKAIGILRMDSAQPNYFHSEDIRLLTTIADLGAVAIENAQLYEKIEDLAIRDGLTGLFLRRHFLARLRHEMSRERRQKKQLSFLMIDLDHFKKLNDRDGHVSGDIVLRTISMILVDFFQEPGQMICRYGGEEFAVMLPDKSRKQAAEMAEALRKKVEQSSIILRQKKTHITISIGAATFPDDADIVDDLIEQADTALYQAKAKGRNRVCYTSGPAKK